MLKPIKLIISGIAFILVFVILLFWFSQVLLPVNHYGTQNIYVPNLAMSDSERGFYAQAPNSLDVLMIGSSNVYRSVNAVQLWTDYGIPSYLYCSSNQSVSLSYFYLLEALKTQSPKVVIWDVLATSWGYEPSEATVRWGLDNMKLSATKLQALQAKDIHVKPLSFEWLSYIFPALRYHDRWTELSSLDFTYEFSEDIYPLKGSDFRYITLPAPENAVFGVNDADYSGISETNLYYMEQIIKLCKSKNIEFIMFKSPTLQWYVSHSNAVDEFAKEHNISYIDFNTMVDELAIQRTSFDDGGYHLNFDGMTKLTAYLGGYLQQNHALEDKRSNDAYQSWNNLYEIFEEEKAVFAVTNEVDPASYVQLLSDSNLSYAIAINGDVADVVVDTLNDAFVDIGLTPSLMKERKSYVAIVDQGKLLYEKQSDSPLWSGGFKFGQNEIAVYSVGYSASSPTATFSISGRGFNLNERGINIVVYDHTFEAIVDVINIRADPNWVPTLTQYNPYQTPVSQKRENVWKN